MKRTTTPAIDSAATPVGKAFEEVSASFERFCLAAGVETLVSMMERDAEAACGPRYSRSASRRGHRWGRTTGNDIGQHLDGVAEDLVMAESPICEDRARGEPTGWRQPSGCKAPLRRHAPLCLPPSAVR